MLRRIVLVVFAVLIGLHSRNVTAQEEMIISIIMTWDTSRTFSDVTEVSEKRGTMFSKPNGKMDLDTGEQGASFTFRVEDYAENFRYDNTVKEAMVQTFGFGWETKYEYMSLVGAAVFLGNLTEDEASGELIYSGAVYAQRSDLLMGSFRFVVTEQEDTTLTLEGDIIFTGWFSPQPNYRM